MARITALLLVVVLATLATVAIPAQQQDNTPTAAALEITVADAGFQLTVPGDIAPAWTHRVQPGTGEITALYLEPADAGGLIQFSIRATEVANPETESAASDAQQISQYIAANEGFSEVQDIQLEVGNQTATGLRLIQAASGRQYRVVLVFLHSRGIRYRFQFHSPRETFDDHWEAVKDILAGFELIELDEAARTQNALRQLALRCGTQVEWSANWEQAAQQATEQDRLIIVSVYAQPGFAIGNQLNESVFMSPEVIALVKHRFVAMRWNRGQPAPFVNHEVFGLSGTTFGAGLLVCTPDGQVVRQMFYLQPLLVADGLRDVLQENPEVAPAPPPDPAADRAEAIAFLIDSGQLNAAGNVLGEPNTNEPLAVTLERVRLHRIRRSGDRALEALRLAKTAQHPDPALQVRLLLEEATVRIGLGEIKAAKEALQQCLNEQPKDDETRAQAMLLLGEIAWAEGNVDQAKAQWNTLAHDLPEQPFAWVAAATLLGPVLDMGITPDIRWPTEAAARIAEIPAAAPASAPFEIKSALVAAADWIVNAQRTDGGWDTRFGMGDTHPAPGPVALAVQSIDTLALFRAAQHFQNNDDPERARACRQAAQRGLTRYLDDRALSRQHPRPVAFMDYTCWGSSYGLFCLTALLNTDFDFADISHAESQAVLSKEIEYLISDLVRIQAGNGGWSYYLSGQIDGQAVGAAMSFTTATVLHALQLAKDAGYDVPDDTLSRGYACLASLRAANGNFAYMRQGEGAFTVDAVGPNGSAARGPICTLALHRGGLLTADAIQPAFQTYADHLAGFSAEARKALMHAGAAGQGSHYLLYDYSTAAEALKAAGPDVVDQATRTAARTAIMHGLSRCRNADGSYIDNPIIGCSAGTGLAVLALLDLAQDDHAAAVK
ncbi:MAG: hypothetical protein HND57_14040 [Planctomycetes bacterium]|nr:hypothetical protein [Planctomycetota bacterium]